MSSQQPGTSVYDDKDKSQVSKSVSSYSRVFADSQENDPNIDRDKVVEERMSTTSSVVETFYNLVTDFYEYGWGQSFHFAPMYEGKDVHKCIAEYEQEVGRKIGAKPGMTILDIGCGVGGPGREIARSTGCNVLGVNYNAYQIEKAKKHSKAAQLDHLCSYVQGDFCDLNTLQDNTYDGGFAFEATCHAKDPVCVYREIFRLLKPGAIFVDCAWAMTDTYNPENPAHEKVKQDVMFGNGLPDLRTSKVIIAAMREAGFEIMEFKDLVNEEEVPWYTPLESKGCCSVKDFRMSTIGRFTTQVMVGALETLSIAPKGTAKVTNILEVGAKSLVNAGRMEIFTPMLFVVTRKPAQ